MFIATITVQSNIFKEEPSEDVLQEIADEFLEEVHRLINEHGFEGEIAVEATWERGCVLEHFALFAANADAWISLATAAGGYKFLKEYKALREGALLITKDLMGFSKTIAGIPVKIVRSVISDREPPRGSGEKLPDLHSPPKKAKRRGKGKKKK